jgi:hypothetical protein
MHITQDTPQHQPVMQHAMLPLVIQGVPAIHLEYPLHNCMWANFWESYLWNKYLPTANNLNQIYADKGPNCWRTIHIWMFTLGWKLHSQSSTLSTSHASTILSYSLAHDTSSLNNLWTTNKAQPQEANNCPNIKNNNNNNNIHYVQYCHVLGSWLWSMRHWLCVQFHSCQHISNHYLSHKNFL